MMPLSYRVPVTVTYPLDPLGPKIGGSASFIRGFIEHAPAHFDLRFVGVTSDVAQRAPGDWRRECLGGREFEFLPLFHEANEDIRRRIPLALRFVAALARTPPGPDGAVLVHNRLETLCARGARAHRNVVIIHNDVHAQIGSGPGEVLWSRFPGLYYRFEQHVFGFADQVYTVSTATLADYRKRYAATAGKFAFVPTYVDTARFRLPEHMHQQRRDRPAVRGLPRSPGAPWILYVGRLQPQKAPVRLIGSFALLRQKWPEAQLIVLGDGNLRGVVEQMVRDLALTGHVHLLGAVEQAELPAFYQAADLLLLASDFEGMPMCVLEALACGLPVASTRVGEVERVVLSGTTGEIAADFSEQALVTAMLEVLDHPANYASRRCAEAVAPYSPARVLAPLYARIDELGRPAPLPPRWASPRPTAMALTIESACGIAAARPWADRWNALAQRAPQRLAMLSHAWVDAYAEALMPADATLHCLFAHAGGDLLGVLPLVVRANGRAPVLLHSASTPYHAHSAFGDLLVDPRRADEAVPALLAQACCHPGLRLREIALRGIAMESPTTALPDRLPGEIAVRQGHRGWGSYLQIEGIWGDYHAGLSKNFRANLRKARTRSRSLATAELRFVWRPAGQASASDLENFLTLEASGWKGRAGSAIGQDARLQRFYARLTENAARLGWLEWHFLYMGERPVAAHMVLRVGRALNLLKIAYDETHAHLSPGSLLFEAAARRAFESGDTDEINCLTDMEWHRGWGMQRREFRDARLYPPTAVAIVFGLLPRRIVEAAKALAVRGRSLGRIAASLRKSRST